MNPGNTEITLRNVRLTVPVYRTAADTAEIVALVTKRLQEIEESSDRIDTQMFALKAAVSFAAELCELRESAAHENQELLSRLRSLNEEIKSLLPKDDTRRKG